MQTRMKQ